MKTMLVILISLASQLNSQEQLKTKQEKIQEQQAEETKEFYSTYSIENLKDISLEDIDTLIEFRQPLEYDSQDWTQNDYFVESQLRDFYLELLEKWVRPFDWREWRKQAWAYYKNPSALEEAQLADIVKTITFHVRKDRYCKGHLLALIQHGHMGEILSRLKKIRATLARQKENQEEKDPAPKSPFLNDTQLPSELSF